MEAYKPDEDRENLFTLAMLWVGSQHPEFLQPLPKFESAYLHLIAEELETLANVPKRMTDVALSPDQPYL